MRLLSVIMLVAAAASNILGLRAVTYFNAGIIPAAGRMHLGNFIDFSPKHVYKSNILCTPIPRLQGRNGYTILWLQPADQKEG